jgi:hypothetical protein
MEGPAAHQAAMGHNPGELTAEHPAPGPQTPLAPKVSNSLTLNPIRPAVLKQRPVGIQHPRRVRNTAKAAGSSQQRPA